MERVLLTIDRLSAGVGKAFGWCIVVLTLGVSYEVFMRYVLRAPTVWAFDISYIMYGALFMMAGAYTLSRNGHVRGDVISRLLPVRVQAGLDLVLYIFFFFPGMTALLLFGLPYAQNSWRYSEVSIYSPAGVPVYPLKAIIPLAAAFLLMQGLAEVIRCVICIREGRWPARLHDVEELETAVLHEQQDRAREAQDRGRESAR